eukprot:3830460-Rhodomonas_salina.1
MAGAGNACPRACGTCSHAALAEDAKLRSRASSHVGSSVRGGVAVGRRPKVARERERGWGW